MGGGPGSGLAAVTGCVAPCCGDMQGEIGCQQPGGRCVEQAIAAGTGDVAGVSRSG